MSNTDQVLTDKDMSMNTQRALDNRIRLFIDCYGIKFEYKNLPMHDKCHLKALWLEHNDLDMSRECSDNDFKESLTWFLKKRSAETREGLIINIIKIFTEDDKYLNAWIEGVKDEYLKEIEIDGDHHE